MCIALSGSCINNISGPNLKIKQARNCDLSCLQNFLNFDKLAGRIHSHFLKGKQDMVRCICILAL